MPEIPNITALGLVLVLIVLTDRWVVRFFRVFTEHLERVELKHNQMILLLEKCLSESSAFQESSPNLSENDYPKTSNMLE